MRVTKAERQAIEDSQNLNALRAAVRAKDADYLRTIERLQKECDRLHARLGIAENVVDVYDGHPIISFGFRSIADIARTRWAEVYPNAGNNGNTYGVNLCGEGSGYGGTWLGKMFTKAGAERLARDWVIYAKMPDRKP